MSWMKDETLSRREWLRRAAAGAAAAAASGGLATALAGCGGARGEGTDSATGPGSDAASPGTDSGLAPSDSGVTKYPTPTCEETDPDALGPYYRAGAPFRTDLNVLGEPGTPLVVRGCVYGTGCAVGLAGALLDVWQANDAGAYDNTSLDFQLRGRMYAGPDGDYEMQTIFPGYYEVSPGAVRPNHIHLTISAPGHVTLTTQLYFASDPLAPTGTAYDTLVVPVTDDGNGGLEAVFEIVLASA